jgi:hypothetical protein
MSKPATAPLCYLCGKPLGNGEKFTREHVPPQGFFARPFPPNLITVPCCGPCNNSKSDIEEVFRLFATSGLDRAPETLKLYEQRTLPRTLKRGRIRKHIDAMLKTARPIWKVYNGVTQPLTMMKLPEGILEAVFSNIARGLTAHTRPELKVHKIPFQAFIPRNVDLIYKAIADLGPGLKELRIGGAAFHSYHGIAADSPSDGVWIMNVHQRICSIVFYGEKTVKEPIDKLRYLLNT